MTRVLVAYATKMGGTREIAEAVGRQLRQGGIDAIVCDAGDAGPVDGYDAAVIGSAVYLSRWRSEAVDLLGRLASSGTERPTWIFQSGPFEDVTQTTEHAVPEKVRRLAAALGAPPVTTFGGRIESAIATGF